MGELDKAKEEYRNVEIPKELNQIVKKTIEENRRLKKNKRTRHIWKAVGNTVVAALAVVVLGLNTSSALAMSAKQIPGLGTVADALTFRQYEVKDEDAAVNVKVPGVTIQRATVEEKAFTNKVNKKIQKQCDAYISDAVKRVREYRSAFLETGGTEKEFASKGIKICVSYEVKSHTKDTVSFVISGTESWISAYASTSYYNLNLDNLSNMTLKDVLGKNYIAIANKSIKDQMEELEAADKNVSFWAENDGGFRTIDEHTNFYINEYGHPVVVFHKYEVAPGFMGNVEFVIGKEKETVSDPNVSQGQNEYTAFAKKIRDVFNEKDQSALADLITYPAYVGIGDGTVVKDKETFMKIDEADIFTVKMIKMWLYVKCWGVIL